jgi:hypothetical protein
VEHNIRKKEKIYNKMATQIEVGINKEVVENIELKIN